MKRFLVACSLALALTALAEQKASAWSKFNFNVGLNISREAAENNFLWGLYRNGPHPFAQGGGEGYGYGGAGQGGFGGQYYNAMPQAGAPATLPAPMQSAPAQMSAPAQTAPVGRASTQQIGYYNWYPSTGYYTVPSYWYGN